MTEAIERFQYTTTSYEWVENPNGYRFKDAHQLRLIDGTIVECATPNNNAWIIHAYPMVDEEAGKKAKRTGQAIEYKQYESEYTQTGTVKEEHVAAIRLLPDAELPWNWLGHRGTTRVRRNRMMFQGALNENEDYSIGAPTRAVPKKISIVARRTNEKLKEGTMPMILGQFDMPKEYADLEFVRTPENKWRLEIPVLSIEIHPHQKHELKEFKVVKQFGAALRIVTSVFCEITDFDTIGEFDFKINSIEVMRPGRRPDYNWEALFASVKLVGRIHFTFYDTPKGEPNEIAG